MADISKISPDDGSTILDLKDTNGRIMSEQLISDTVGWTGKNKFNVTTASKTVSDVIYTVNDDRTITANGTASGTSFCTLGDLGFLNSIDEEVIITGCPSGGNTANGYSMSPRISSNMGLIRYNNVDINDIGTGTSFNPSNCTDANGNPITDWSACTLIIRIGSGISVTNKTFYPMIRIATISDSTYEPYHDTVEKELTDSVTPVDITSSFFSNIPTGVTLASSSNIAKVGKIIVGEIVLSSSSFDSGTQYELTIDSKYRPLKNYNTTGIFTDNEWSGMTDGFTGYFFLGNGGACYIKNNGGSAKTIFKGQFAFTQ